ncbi:MAG TPA: hypothetical protein VGG39_22315 [Polyangiaceae bacterium]
MGRRDPQYIRFTWSQSNDKPLGGPERQTFSFQSGSPPDVGQEVGGIGNVQLGTSIYTGPCRLTISSDVPGEGGAGPRSVEGTFFCEKMRNRDQATVEIKVSSGRISGVVIGSEK